MCSCVDGYTGDICEVPPLDPCEEIVCENDGQCEEQAGVGVCVCAPGFEGPNCENEVTNCDPNPCLNGGVCSDGLGGPLCTCTDGYTGSLCEFAPAVDPCAPNPCLNGGECMDVSSSLCQGDTCDSLACKEAVCALDAVCCYIWDGLCRFVAGLPGAGGVDWFSDWGLFGAAYAYARWALAPIVRSWRTPAHQIPVKMVDSVSPQRSDFNVSVSRGIRDSSVRLK